MKYLLLDGFPRGLDARKFNLSAPPGTLVELSNGHLTNAGEIEKRKAFEEFADVAIGETGGEATSGVRTFGVQETADGLTVFGSALAYGTSPTQSQPVLASAMPSGVSYQQLQHVAVLDGETYDKTKHAIVSTGAIFGGVASCLYAGLVFAVATFADGQTFGYYNGVLVRDFTDGLRLAHLDTNVKLATALTQMVNRSDDYTATQLANPNDHKVNITGPEAVVYDLAAIQESSAGTLAVSKTSDPTPATSGSAAVGGFTVVAGSSSPGTNKITQVEVNGVVITNAAVDWTTSNEVTAALLAASINLATSSPDYTAVATGNSVTITAALAVGDTPNNYEVKVTAAGNVCIGRSQFQVLSTTPFTTAECYINGVVIGGTVNWTTNASTTAAAIASAINSGTGSHGYLANATGAILTVSKAVTSSSDTPIPIYFVTSPNAGGIIEVDTGVGSVGGLTVSVDFTYQTWRSAPGGFVWTFYMTVSVKNALPPVQEAVWSGAGVTRIDATHFSVSVYTQQPPTRPPNPPALTCSVSDARATAYWP